MSFTSSGFGKRLQSRVMSADKERSWRLADELEVPMHHRGREGHRLTLTTWDTEVGRLAADRDEVCQDKLELEIKYWTLVFYDFNIVCCQELPAQVCAAGGGWGQAGSGGGAAASPPKATLKNYISVMKVTIKNPLLLRWRRGGD